MKVAVGSTNPVKVRCVSDAFMAVWGRRVTGVPCPVESTVRAQPLDEGETLEGARSRAKAALALGLSPTFAVGLEGGLVDTPAGVMECGWAVVLDDLGREGVAATARIAVPESWVERLRGGEELGPLCDEHFSTTNVGQANGYFGLMTNDAVTRTTAYRDAVAFALARFVHPGLFEPLTAIAPTQRPVPDTRKEPS